MGKRGSGILLAGIGGIRACGRAPGSIPLGLASTSSHSALVSLGLCTVNTPSLMSWHNQPKPAGGTSAQFMSVDSFCLDLKEKQLDSTS